jgi:hypothetical protein
MSIRQTALFACLVSMTFSASAHEYSCSAINGTRAVLIASFRFTQAELENARKNHNPETCSVPAERQGSGAAATQKLQSPAPKPDTQLAAARPNPPNDYLPPMCGVVDNHDFHIASSQAMIYCKKQAATTRGSAANVPKPDRKVAFRVRSPGSYNAVEHHTAYRFTDGDLVGACYVCVPIRRPDAVAPLSGTIRQQEVLQPKN